MNLVQERGKSLVRIEVADTGNGMPADQLPHIFKPFFRGAGGKPNKGNGVGLGLAIAQRAIEAHGGTITAKNADGGGLVVEIRIPTPGNPAAPEILIAKED